MEGNKVNVEANERIQQKWDGMAKGYEESAKGKSNVQSTVTCASMTKAYSAKTIIEVGCGTGLTSLLLASSFLTSEKGVLVACDLAPQMIQLLKANFSDASNDYCQVPGNKSLVDTETNFCELNADQSLKHKVDLPAIIQGQGDFRKLVYGCVANNEVLPFGDNLFDSYIANLSLNLVDNRVNMLREACRVLAPGGAACFTVWGPRDKCSFFTVVYDVLVKYYPEEKLKAFHGQFGAFRCFEEKDQVIEEMKHAGFTCIKVWEQAQSVNFRDGADFMD